MYFDFVQCQDPDVAQRYWNPEYEQYPSMDNPIVSLNNLQDNPKEIS